MTGLSRGDVVLVLFQNSDLITFKKRPALVVQADNLAATLEKAVVQKLGQLSDLTAVNNALRATLGL